MGNPILMAVVWLVAVLVVVPWFFLAAVPVVVAVALPLAFLLGGVVLLTFVLQRRPAAEAESDAYPIERVPGFRTFVDAIPGWREQALALRTMLAGYARATSEKLGACACMLQKDGKVQLTVRVRHDHRFASHQVLGATPGEALHRMEWKLSREALRRERGRELSAPFCARPWCCNAARCPYLHGRSGFRESARLAVGLTA